MQFIKLSLAFGLDILYNGRRRIVLNLAPSFRDRTIGLCGTLNKNQKDDFRTPQGNYSIINTFILLVSL